MDLIDTHIHLDFEQYDTDRSQLIERAYQADVKRIITIGAGGGIESTRRAVALAQQIPNVFATVGVHPHDAAKEISLEEITQLASKPKVIAVGETGLDFFREWSPPDMQRKWFADQISLALKIRKPLIVHSRDAAEACLEMLIELGAAEVGGVFHCYSEDENFAEKLRSINFLVSFTGTITFKKADRLRSIVKEIPLEQIMLETDGPYMAPEPFRGQKSESAHVRIIAERVAQVKNVAVEEVARVTTNNAVQLFKLGELG